MAVGVGSAQTLGIAVEGSLAWFHISTVLQALGVSGRSWEMTVFAGQDLVATIRLVGDLVVEAKSHRGREVGIPAFWEAFKVQTDGRFEVYRTETASHGETYPLGTITTLLLGTPATSVLLCGQGHGPVEDGECYFAGDLDELPLDELLPLIAQQGRSSRLYLQRQDCVIGSLVIDGDIVLACNFDRLSGMAAFRALAASPSGLRFYAEKGAGASNGALPHGPLGTINQLLLSAVVHRDETMHGVISGPTPGTFILPPARSRGSVEAPDRPPIEGAIEIPWNPVGLLEGSPEALDANFQDATRYMIQQRYEEAEVLLTFLLTVDPTMDRARTALKRVWARRRWAC